MELEPHIAMIFFKKNVDLFQFFKYGLVIIFSKVIK